MKYLVIIFFIKFVLHQSDYQKVINPFLYNDERQSNIPCSHGKIFKVCMAIFGGVKSQEMSNSCEILRNLSSNVTFDNFAKVFDIHCKSFWIHCSAIDVVFAGINYTFAGVKYNYCPPCSLLCNGFSTFNQLISTFYFEFLSQFFKRK